VEKEQRCARAAVMEKKRPRRGCTEESRWRRGCTEESRRAAREQWHGSCGGGQDSARARVWRRFVAAHVDEEEGKII
jgi:hypothetical protein